MNTMRSVLTQTSPVGQVRKTLFLSNARSHCQAWLALSRGKKKRQTKNQHTEPALCSFNLKANLRPCIVVCSEWLPITKHLLWEFIFTHKASFCIAGLALFHFSSYQQTIVIRIICLVGLRNMKHCCSCTCGIQLATALWPNYYNFYCKFTVQYKMKKRSANLLKKNSFHQYS